MGQISIPIANKVGYSMYWSSMWDNKINFSRSFKEDVFLRRFTTLLFNDSISYNIVSYNKKDFKNLNLKKYSIHFKEENLPNLKKFIFKKTTFKSYYSKVWILKYQSWIVLYFFVYSSNFNNLTKPHHKIKMNLKLRSFSGMYSNYLKANEKVNLSYSIYKKFFKRYF